MNAQERKRVAAMTDEQMITYALARQIEYIEAERLRMTLLDAARASQAPNWRGDYVNGERERPPKAYFEAAHKLGFHPLTKGGIEARLAQLDQMAIDAPERAKSTPLYRDLLEA